MFRSYVTELQEYFFFNINNPYELRHRILYIKIPLNIGRLAFIERKEVGVLNTGTDTFAHQRTLLVMWLALLQEITLFSTLGSRRTRIQCYLQ